MNNKMHHNSEGIFLTFAALWFFWLHSVLVSQCWTVEDKKKENSGYDMQQSSPARVEPG